MNHKILLIALALILSIGSVPSCAGYGNYSYRYFDILGNEAPATNILYMINGSNGVNVNGTQQYIWTWTDNTSNIGRFYYNSSTVYVAVNSSDNATKTTDIANGTGTSYYGDNWIFNNIFSLYHFSGISGSSWYDTARGYNLSQSSTTVTKGPYNNAINFTGAPANVNTTCITGWENSTISFWFRLNNTYGADDMQIFMLSRTTGGFSIVGAVPSGTTNIYFRTKNEAGTTQFDGADLQTTSPLTLGTWYYVTLALNKTGTTTTGTLYINGKLNVTHTDASDIADTDCLLTFFGANLGVGRYLSAQMDEFIWYKNTLNQNQVKAIYNTSLSVLNESYTFPTTPNTNPTAIIYNLSAGYYYKSLNLPFKFEARDSENTTIILNATLNGVSFYYNASYTNSTNISMTLNITTPGDYNFTLKAIDSGGLIGTDYQAFSIYSYNITEVNFSAKAKETDVNNYNITFIYNPDIIANITSELNFNGVNYGWYDSNITLNKSANTTVTNFKSILTPLIPANNTAYLLLFVNYIAFKNGSTIIQNSGIYFQNITTVFNNVGLGKNATHITEGQYFSINYTLSAILPMVNNNRTVNATVNISFDNTKYVMIPLHNTSSMYYFNITLISPNISTYNYSAYYNATIYLTMNGDSRNITTFGYFIVVDNIAFDINCSSGIYSINFTMSDEDYPTIIFNYTITSMEIDLTAWDENNTYLGAFSFGFNGTETTLCLTPSYAKLKVNATIIYRALNFYQRNYYLIDAWLSSDTTVLPLYLLNETYSGLARTYTETVLGEPYANVFVKIQRYYPESATGTTGSYRTIGMVKTADISGDAYTYLKYNDAFYRFVVQEGSTVIKTFSQRQIVKNNFYDNYASILLRMDDITGEYYNYLKNEILTWSCSASNLTAMVTCSYNDPSGLANIINLTVKKYVSNISWIDKCSNIETSDSGSIYCNVSSYGNGTYWYFLRVITTEGNTYNLENGILNIGSFTTFGQNGLFIILFIFLVCALIGAHDFNIGMVMACVGLIFGYIVTGEMVVGVAGIISIIFVAGIFIIKKGNDK